MQLRDGTTGGYFFPETRREIAEFRRSLKSRAENTLVAIESAEKALNSPEWQQDGKDSEEINR